MLTERGPKEGMHDHSTWQASAAGQRGIALHHQRLSPHMLLESTLLLSMCKAPKVMAEGIYAQPATMMPIQVGANVCK